MRKPFPLVLIIMLLVLSTSLYATDPTENFQVETIVGTRHGLKLVLPGTTTPSDVATFEGLTANNQKFTVTDSNYSSAQTVKKLIGYCNSVAGYDVLLAASAMISTTSPSVIKYSVTAGGASVTTNANGTETSATNKVATKASLDNIDFFGTDIVITVNANDYLNAVTGTYTGTIKITLVSN